MFLHLLFLHSQGLSKWQVMNGPNKTRPKLRVQSSILAHMLSRYFIQHAYLDLPAAHVECFQRLRQSSSGKTYRRSIHQEMQLQERLMMTECNRPKQQEAISFLLQNIFAFYRCSSHTSSSYLATWGRFSAHRNNEKRKLRGFECR